MEMRLAPIARGMLTLVPALNKMVPGKRVGHTDSPRYCYGVWMKHLALLNAHGMRGIPRVVAELGPGESIGVGIAALLSGAERYVGLDVAAHSARERNLRMLDALIPLFHARTPRPERGWPDIGPWLDERGFPSEVLTDELLERTLAPPRIEAIRRALSGSGPMDAPEISVEYRAPWSDPGVVESGSLDLVFSHSVLEHVVDLADTYRALHQWLKPGGWMSHQVDFKSHGITRTWNGFRGCSERVWNLALGRRTYMINREPVSVHLRLMREAGFTIVERLKYLRDDGLRREDLAPRWMDITEEDLRCSGLYVVARR